MKHFLIYLFSIFFSVASQLDLNPAHQLCQPCILAANTIKSTSKSPSVKEAQKHTCNTILRNTLVCDGAVEVAAIYLNWTPAETICENFRMCSESSDGKKMSPVKGAPKPGKLEMRVLQILKINETPTFPRQKRQVPPVDLNTFNITDFQILEKEIRSEFGDVQGAVYQFLAHFQSAVEMYLEQTSSQKQ